MLTPLDEKCANVPLSSDKPRCRCDDETIPHRSFINFSLTPDIGSAFENLLSWLGTDIMRTSGNSARVARRWLWLNVLVLSLHCGCGGGNQDFGPTQKVGPPSGAKEPVVAANPTAPTKPVASGMNSESADVATDPTESKPPTNSDPKTAVSKAEPEAKTNSRRSREDDDSPASVAKSSEKSASSAKTDPPSKDNPEHPPLATETEAESSAVARKPLSPELREWLIAKRRQASSLDGLAVLTAADLSKVSWHDLRTGQLSHEFFAQNGLTTGLIIGPTQRWVMGATDAGWLRLWTIESSAGLDRIARATRRAAQALLGGIDTEQEGIWALAADRQGEWFLCGGADGSLRICSFESITLPDAAAGEPAAQLAIKLGAKVPAHEGTVTDLEISADGVWVASGGSDCRVCLWDAKTGTVTRTWTDSPGQITDVGISADGKIVAASCLDKFVRWWSTDAPELPVAESTTKPAKANQADGQKVAAKETTTKNVLEHPDIVLSVAVSADGHFVATGGKDKIVRVWELATGQVVEKHDGAKDAVVEVRFLDGDKRLFIRDRSGVVRSKPRTRRSTDDEDSPPPESERPWQFVTPLALLGSPHETIPAASEFTPITEQQTALRNAASREARAAARQSLLKTMNPETEDSDAAKADQVAALEKQLASATSDTFKSDLKRQLSRLKTVAVSQERTERPKLLGTLTSQFSFVSGPGSSNRSGSHAVQLAIHGDAELLTTTTSPAGIDSDDERRRPTENPASQLWVWDIPTQSLLRHWDDVRSGLEACSFVDSANQIVSSSGQVFSLPTGESRALGRQTLDRISSVVASSDGRHLAVGYAGSVQATTSVLRLFETATLQEVRSHEAFEGLTTAIAFSPEGTSLAVAVRERQLHRLLILDATTLALLATVEEQPHSAPWLQGLQTETRDRGLTTLRFSSDGRFLLTHGSYGSGEYRLTLWQKKGTKWTKENAVNSKASQPIVDDAQPPAPLWFVGGKGTQMAAISSKGLGIIDTSNGRLLRSVELKHGLKDRHPAAWSADGTWMAQGDETGQVTLWNLRIDKEAAVFPAQLGPVKALTLSSDGRVLATLGEENKLHLWNLEGWQPKNRVAAKAKATKPASTD